MNLLDIYERSDMFRSVEGGEVSIETASLFTCGIVLKEIFFPSLAFCKEEEYSFEQVWYMICLYHDERMETPHIWKRMCSLCKDRRVRGLEGRNIDTDNKWQPMQLGVSPFFHYIEEGIRYTNGACVRKCLLTETEVKDYFYFRNTCYNAGGMDHGIAGGLILYENLIRRRLQSRGELDKRVLNLYSYAANTLMVHNLCEREDEKKRIMPDMDPLLLLFVLAEAVEPLQYSQYEADCRMLLKAVEVEIFEKEFIVKMNPELFDIDEMEKRIETMKKRIRVSCEILRQTSEVCIRM